jgi:hypothetical protein
MKAELTMTTDTNADAEPVAEAGAAPELAPPPELPLELSELREALQELSRGMAAVSNDFPKLLANINTLKKLGWAVQYSTHELKVEPNDDAGLTLNDEKTRIVASIGYENLANRIEAALELQSLIKNKLTRLPPAIVEKLPAKDGSPWRSYYLRECLDVLDRWPADITTPCDILAPSINAADLITAARLRVKPGGLPLVERFARYGHLLMQAAEEITSLRFEFAALPAPPAATSEPAAIIAPGTPIPTPELTDTDDEKKYQPTLETLRIIDVIRTEPDNNSALEKLKEKGLEPGIKNLRQVRSRYERGQYKL